MSIISGRPAAPRKRSRLVRLTTMTAMAGGATLLSGCEGPAPVDDGPPVEVAAYADVGECVRSQNFSQVECRTAAQSAVAAQEKEAPRFEDSQTCEEQFGAGQCMQSSTNNQSFFMPLATGFLIGQMLNGGGGYRYAPLYRRSDDGSYYTGGGVRLQYGNGANRYYTGSRAMETPRSIPRVQSRSSVVSRGGFGGRSYGGGWGG